MFGLSEITMKHVFLLFGLALLISSCGSETTMKYRISGVTFNDSGPLFEGPVTLQHEFANTINDSLSKNGYTPEQLKKITLSSATYTCNDSLGFDGIGSLVFQLTAENTSMLEAGVINPIPAGSKAVSLKPSAEANLVEFFKQPKIFLITDANAVRDAERELNIKADFEFEVVVSQ